MSEINLLLQMIHTWVKFCRVSFEILAFVSKVDHYRTERSLERQKYVSTFLCKVEVL